MIAILLVYLALTLSLGAKRIYFDPFVEKPDDKPEEKTNDQNT
jgi:hypothetical protein